MSAGSSLQLHVTTQANGDAARDVVLVHGWSASGAVFAPQLAALPGRLLAPDLRGHGRSPAPATGYAVGDFALDLARLLDDHGVRRAVLVGWSWGAEVCLAALPRLGGRIAGLALLAGTPRFATAPDWPHGTPEANVRALSRRLARDPAGTRRLFVEQVLAPGELEPGAREAAAQRLLADEPAVHAARATLDALVATDLRDALGAAAGLPALLVHGDADAVVPPAASAWLAEALPGARLERLPGAGHAPHLTRPDAVNALLAGFLEEVAW
jgi:pimeloyl-[acyl-carrier protein] methyl ester esterase